MKRSIPSPWSVTLVLLATLICSTVAYANDSQAAFWKNLDQPGHFVMMRHALAPGTGDPQNFDLEDCSTQRNLNEAGRSQARAIGEAFRRNGVEAAEVYSSVWCRCRETAELLGRGSVDAAPFLNSFFRNRERGPEQTRELLARAKGITAKGGKPVVFVTHQVNITAATGVYPQSGEMVLARFNGNDEIEVVAQVHIGTTP